MLGRPSEVTVVKSIWDWFRFISDWSVEVAEWVATDILLQFTWLIELSWHMTIR